MGATLLPTVLSAVRYVVAIAALAYAAYSDAKTRMVDDRVWLALLTTAAPFILLELATFERATLALYFVSAYLAFTLGLSLPTLGLMGDADFLALACIGLTTPPSRGGLLSAVPSLSVFVNSLLVSCVYPLLLLVRNVRLIASRVEMFEGVEASLPEKLLALLTLTKVPVDEFKRKRGFYALAEASVNGRKRLLFRARVASEETGDAEALNGDWVWVSPHVPFVASIAAGYVIHILLGCLLDPLLIAIAR